MKKPVIRVLLKVVASGFYQEHTGLLLALFILIFCNFFYTSVLNQTHLTQEQITLNALKLVLTTVSEPLGVVFLLSLFLLYSVKCGQYVARRVKQVDVQFLAYSITALSWGRQLQSWLVVQLVMSMPIIGLGLFAMLIGFTFGHWLIPLLIPIYLVGLIGSGAGYYTYLLNRTTIESAKTDRIGWLSHWPKPFFSLFLYDLVATKRISYIITKVASLLSIGVLFSVFPDSHSDVRLVGLISLCVALTHCILIYQSSEFEAFYLRFARNFPYPRWQLYAQQVALLSVLLLPEGVWLMVAGGLKRGFTGALMIVSISLLFRTLLYRLGQRMDTYLRIVFGLFTFFLVLILFSGTEVLIIGSGVGAWMLLSGYQNPPVA